ncbi:MAG: NADH-quinone oxidoreductase subunit L [Gemmatimonadota bacterium]|jgi:NADH-quinone oxidoreductase subunit L|nr:NADH-quinone oxidoreductase subunit L [Gemmatimonadota bacterium]
MLTTGGLILGIPLFAFVVQFTVGRRLPRQGDWVSTGAVFAAFLLSIPNFLSAVAAGGARPVDNPRFVWMDLGTAKLSLGILSDNLMAVMLTAVLFVSFLIHVYSMGYMKGEERYNRFFGYLSLFIFSMMGIIMADSLLGLYIFWELVGVSSYFLIGFYIGKPSANAAAKKAFITNRVGDAFMFVGIAIVLNATGTLHLPSVFTAVAHGDLSGGTLTAAGLCLFMGAVGKSAQFPLHVWLPDAMEGPTPVSALIHAATMVAAGVYFVARMYPVLTPDALLVVAYIGGITAIMAALIAVTQFDIKRVLAYSTMSQLGYMVMALGVGAYTAGFLHLVTHAVFKALLFLGSGSVIHAVHTQDMREMGGLSRKMPVTYGTFLVGTLALAGIPLTSGFVSKDAILAGTLAFAGEHPAHLLLPIMGFAAAGLTAFYMFRLLFMTFWGKPADAQRHAHAHESPAVMTGPLVVLCVFCFYAFFTFPSGNPFGGEGWFHELIHAPESVAVANAHDAAHGGGHGEVAHSSGEHHGSAHSIAMMLSLLMAAGGIVLAWLTYGRRLIRAEALAARLGPVYRLVRDKFRFDELYAATVIALVRVLREGLARFDGAVIDGIVNATAPVLRFFASVSGGVDRYGVDGLVNGVASVVERLGDSMRRPQTGRIQNYLAVSVGLLLLIVLTSVLAGAR